ncbi:GNAT family N-acetyltransferase [Arthrobacter sp. TWP1-1]|uniref:GNAT family N-acetyltransferase n=1 Tax=Arthrobacter sp. TWP1-1 TaxID=2804568 RepID=UPI003CF3C46A
MSTSTREPTETRLDYRAFTSADIAAVHEYASDPVVTRWSTWGPNTLEQTAAFVESAAIAHRAQNHAAYSLAAVLSGHVIGSVAVWTTDFSDHNGELGYTFHRAHWGKGYATEAVCELLRLGFGPLELWRISATCHPDNVGSIRVLEKSGFTFEGRLRSHRAVNGTRRDSMLYSILREDYTQA